MELELFQLTVCVYIPRRHPPHHTPNDEIVSILYCFLALAHRLCVYLWFWSVWAFRYCRTAHGFWLYEFLMYCLGPFAISRTCISVAVAIVFMLRIFFFSLTRECVGYAV